MNDRKRAGSSGLVERSLGLLLQKPKTWIERFIDQRTPVQNKVTLKQNKIYILPSRYGIVMLWLTLALFLGGVNYSNSIMLSLSYLLVSLFLVALLHTYRNLSGLCLEASHEHNGFAGENVMFEVNVSRQEGRHHEAVRLRFNCGTPSEVSLINQQQAIAKLWVPVERRGLFSPGRMRIETRFPLGLFVSWAYVRFNAQAWVYPKPLENNQSLKTPTHAGNDASSLQSGSDDFYGLRRYSHGDSLRHVDWKAYARGHELHTKTFVDPQEQDVWLDWQSFSGVNREQMLGCLCYWVLHFSKSERLFGLRLPNTEIEIGKGVQHKARCLLALAQA